MAELSKTFSPEQVEQKWYAHWERAGAFKPRPGRTGESFCMVMPPPNVTGILHMGHALDVTTQDVLTRYKRMKGYETLWLPGMDHAGIATQSVVEKKLYDEEGKLRRDYTREEFLERVWEWKRHHGGLIQEQQRALGSSCDWDYSLFTMDPQSNRAVNRAFVSLYREGLIYQADYIVNWDTQLQTAISDAEVEHQEGRGGLLPYSPTRVKGVAEESLLVATTRPETLLGDTAVAVHPEDARFKHLIGQSGHRPALWAGGAHDCRRVRGSRKGHGLSQGHPRARLQRLCLGPGGTGWRPSLSSTRMAHFNHMDWSGRDNWPVLHALWWWSAYSGRGCF